MRKLLFQAAAGFLAQKAAQVVQKNVNPKLVEAIQKPLTGDNIVGRTLSNAHEFISPITDNVVVNAVVPVVSQTVRAYESLLPTTIQNQDLTTPNK